MAHYLFREYRGHDEFYFGTIAEALIRLVLKSSERKQLKFAVEKLAVVAIRAFRKVTRFIA